MVNALRGKKLKINVSRPNVVLNMGSNISVSILSPIGSSYEEMNNYSSIVKISFGDTKFLFMGDAEKLVEKQLIDNKTDISADVIKIGHHGSNSSSSTSFLDKVSPKYAIISCGKNNDYGHPHKEVLEYLQAKKITLYRTDLNKDIVLKSNGNSIEKE
jgi:competence protein ComEC